MHSKIVTFLVNGIYIYKLLHLCSNADISQVLGTLCTWISLLLYRRLLQELHSETQHPYFWQTYTPDLIILYSGCEYHLPGSFSNLWSFTYWHCKRCFFRVLFHIASNLHCSVLWDQYLSSLSSCASPKAFWFPSVDMLGSLWIRKCSMISATLFFCVCNLFF